jgi:hypothetical protein
MRTHAWGYKSSCVHAARQSRNAQTALPLLVRATSRPASEAPSLSPPPPAACNGAASTGPMRSHASLNQRSSSSALW